MDATFRSKQSRFPVKCCKCNKKVQVQVFTRQERVSPVMQVVGTELVATGRFAPACRDYCGPCAEAAGPPPARSEAETDTTPEFNPFAGPKGIRRNLNPQG